MKRGLELREVWVIHCVSKYGRMQRSARGDHTIDLCTLWRSSERCVSHTINCPVVNVTSLTNTKMANPDTTLNFGWMPPMYLRIKKTEFDTLFKAQTPKMTAYSRKKQNLRKVSNSIRYASQALRKASRDECTSSSEMSSMSLAE